MRDNRYIKKFWQTKIQAFHSCKLHHTNWFNVMFWTLKIISQGNMFFMIVVRAGVNDVSKKDSFAAGLEIDPSHPTPLHD